MHCAKFLIHTVYVTIILSLCCLGGCIYNDLPYPKIPQLILEIEAEGELKPSYIDSISYEVNIYLDEQTDIRNVRFLKYIISDGAVSIPNLNEGKYDLSSPVYVSLTRFQEYTWEIIAHQTISRYFEVAGEVGESIVDFQGKRVVVNMPEGTDLSKLELLKVKLGPEGITKMDPDLKPGPLDLSYPKRVSVSYHGVTEIWTIYAQYTEAIVSTVSADAWSEVLWVYGAGPADAQNGFEYKEVGSSQWIRVPEKYISKNQGSFSGYIPHLTPLSKYIVRAYSDSYKGNEIEVNTQATADIPNGDFEDWCKIGKTIFPYAEGGIEFWDTGNTGSSTLGQNVTEPSEHTPTGKGLSAECRTEFVGVFGIGKLAAGSIYTGKFKKVDGTNGILDFGQPWNLRPTKLKGYFQYKSQPIDYTSAEYASLKGTPDICVIYVALTDWTTPFEIRTNPKNRNLFNKEADYIIGYGEMEFSGDMDGFREFVIDIKYRDTSRIPSFLQITCSTSKYGDYFTGGTGSILWVDQLSFDWDLE